MVSQLEIENLFNEINEKLKILNIKAYFVNSEHSLKRINDSRNVPEITIIELTDIFTVLIQTKSKQLTNILKSDDKYTIYAMKSDIDIWIGINSGDMMVIKSLIRHNSHNKYPPILKIFI